MRDKIREAMATWKTPADVDFYLNCARDIPGFIQPTPEEQQAILERRRELAKRLPAK